MEQLLFLYIKTIPIKNKSGADYYGRYLILNTYRVSFESEVKQIIH